MKNKLAPLQTNGHFTAPTTDPSYLSCRSALAKEDKSDLEPETQNSKPETASPQAGPREAGTRTGKIARLPVEAREEVNQMLRSGFRHAAIVEKLAELGHPDISINSIYTWKYGGFVDWLHAKQKFESSLGLPKAFEQCTKAGRIAEIQQVAVTFASTALGEIMHKFDFNRALDALYRQPQLFPSFVHSIAALTRCSSDLANAFARMQDTETLVRQKLGLTADMNAGAPFVPPAFSAGPVSPSASSASPAEATAKASPIDDPPGAIGDAPSAIGDRLSAISPSSEPRH